jgi:hypothetical protein
VIYERKPCASNSIRRQTRFDVSRWAVDVVLESEPPQGPSRAVIGGPRIPPVRDPLGPLQRRSHEGHIQDTEEATSTSPISG